MVDTEKVINALSLKGVSFYTGVPDSLLSPLSAYFISHLHDKHIIAANEGNAIGLAAGHYLSTGECPVVYLQNSGFGNTVNPLLSLADQRVYSIPMLMIVGWRGEPGVKDEPQHIAQGEYMIDLFKAMRIPYIVLSMIEEEAICQISEAVDRAKNESSPFAILVKKGTFKAYACEVSRNHQAKLLREQVIETILEAVDSDSIIVCTTGKASRELYEIRERLGLGHEKDFLTVGSMGHSLQIAHAIALEKKNRKVVCIDGDGAALMHMGGMAIVGNRKLENLTHILINNASHDSVGGQPTVAGEIDFTALARSLGYPVSYSVNNEQDLKKVLSDDKSHRELSFIEVKVKLGSRKDLGRPKESPLENKIKFMDFVR